MVVELQLELELESRSRTFNVSTANLDNKLAQTSVPLLVVTSNIMPSVNHHPGHPVTGKPEFVKMRKRPCHGGRFCQKAVEISNLFREALGLPLIKSDSHNHGLDDGKVRILPFIGSPNIFAPVHPVHGKDMEGAVKFITVETTPDGHHHEYHTHGLHHHNKGHHRFGRVGKVELSPSSLVSPLFLMLIISCLHIDQAAVLELSSGCSLSWPLPCTAL